MVKILSCSFNCKSWGGACG